jgi:hypothetical protein
MESELNRVMQKRAEALLAGEKRLLEMIASGDSLHAVLDALCRLIEENVTGSYCSVVLIDPSGTRLKHGARPVFPAPSQSPSTAGP